MSIQTKTMTVKSDTSLAETTTTIRDTVTFDVSNMPNGITYKGLKAVLSFAEPIQWNKASTYDALTVVWDDASHGSYASKRPVPANIELTNEFYWLRTADLDAQVEMYRQEVQQFDGRITANVQAIAAETTRAEGAEEALKQAIAAETARAEGAEEALKTGSTKVVVFGDSWTDPNQPAHPNRIKWLTDIQNAFGADFIKSFGVQGATISQFNAQIAKATAAIEDVENVTHVAIIGGVNGGTSAELNSFCAKVKTAFPKCDITFFANCWPADNVNGITEYQNYATQYKDVVCAYVPIIKYMGLVSGFFAYEEEFPNLHQHLSNIGSVYFRKLFMAALFGGSIEESVALNPVDVSKSAKFYLVTAKDSQFTDTVTLHQPSEFNLSFGINTTGRKPYYSLTSSIDPTYTGYMYMGLCVKDDEVYNRCLLPYDAHRRFGGYYAPDSVFIGLFEGKLNVTIGGTVYKIISQCTKKVTSGIGLSMSNYA